MQIRVGRKSESQVGAPCGQGGILEACARTRLLTPKQSGTLLEVQGGNSVEHSRPSQLALIVGRGVSPVVVMVATVIMLGVHPSFGESSE